MRTGTLLRRYALSLCIAGAYLYTFPYFEELKNANELPRIWLTQAIVDEHRFAIDTGVARYGYGSDVGELDRPSTPNSGTKGKFYSIKAPGISFLAVPTYMMIKVAHRALGGVASLRQLTYWFRLTTSTIPTLLFLWLLSYYLGRVCQDLSARRLAIVGYGLGSLAFTNGTLFAGHQLAADLAMTSYILARLSVWDRLGNRVHLLTGLSAGLALIADYEAVFFCLPGMVYLMFAKRSNVRSCIHSLVLVALGAMLPAMLLLFYNKISFGSPWTTGYSTSLAFAHQLNKGFLGLTAHPSRRAFLGSFFTTDNGLLVLSPMFLLTLPGILFSLTKPLTRADGLSAIWALGFGAWFISSLAMWRGGWTLGPRYLAAALPFLIPSVAIALARFRSGETSVSAVAWPLSIGLVIVSVTTYSTLGALYPAIPSYESKAIFLNPLYDIGFRFLAGGRAPYSLGWLLGLHGVASLLPYFALLTGAILIALFAGLDVGQQRLLTVCGLVSGVLLVGLISFAPQGHYRNLDCYGNQIDADELNCFQRLVRKYEPRAAVEP